MRSMNKSATKYEPFMNDSSFKSKRISRHNMTTTLNEVKKTKKNKKQQWGTDLILENETYKECVGNPHDEELQRQACEVLAVKGEKGTMTVPFYLNWD